MGGAILQRSRSQLWRVAQRQHGVVARRQLLALGFSPKAIEHRIAKGRLHPVLRGVYAVGRPALTSHGRWMASVLGCGPEAVLSHESAAALWMIRPSSSSRIDVSVPASVARGHRGIVVHRFRFTRAQVRFDPGRVQATLSAVADRLRADQARPA